jgi:hypothetical protein
MHELEEILVTGDDRDLEPCGERLFGKRTDDVVGLEALRRQDRHTERFACFVHPGNLLGEIRRHRRTIGLVVARHSRPERRAGQIERGGDELRLMVGHQLSQHHHEDVDGVRRLAAGTGEAGTAHRVIRAVHLRAAVDQENAGSRGHRSSNRGGRTHVTRAVLRSLRRRAGGCARD